MITVRFVIWNKEKDRIEKSIVSQRFRDDQETEAQLFINTTDFKRIFSRYKLDTVRRPMLYYINTKTGEKSLEALD